MSTDRARIAYEAFRNGFQGGVLPPEWDKAPSWIRDAIRVAYLQGTLDAAHPAAEAPLIHVGNDGKPHGGARNDCWKCNRADSSRGDSQEKP